jgi:hypothetical protein
MLNSPKLGITNDNKIPGIEVFVNFSGSVNNPLINKVLLVSKIAHFVQFELNGMIWRWALQN